MKYFTKFDGGVKKMPKRNKIFISLAALMVVFVLGTAAAMATPDYMSKVPADKASAGCSACHGDGFALNSEGQAFAQNGNVWPAAAVSPEKPAAPASFTEGQFVKMLTDGGYYVKADNPSAAITRNQAAVYLVKALGIANTAKDMPASEAAEILKKFSDAGKIQQASLVAAAVKNGLMVGYGTSFGAVDKLTENQAKILASVISQKAAAVGALPNYVGSETCKGCHAEDYKAWKGTGHSRHVLSVNEPGALGAAFESNPYFDQKDAVYRLGGMTQFRFLERHADGDYYYLPGTWNIETSTWSENKSLSNWSTGCATCHTTGYNKTSKQFDEMNITCESCHGPGLQHVTTGGDKSKINKSVDNDTCASCHGGQVSQLEGMGEKFAVDGVAKAGHSYHFKESLTEGSALSGHYSDNCMECHSATVFLAEEEGKEPPTLEDFKTGAYKDDRVGISCVVCHDPHKKAEEFQLRKDTYETCVQCHTSEADLKSGSAPHHPQKEFIEGQYLVNGTLNKEMSSGHTECTSCHMANGNHYFKVGDPSITLDVHGAPTEFNSCISCHKDAAGNATITTERMETFMNATKARLDKIKADWAVITAKKDSLTGTDLQTYNDDIANLGILSAEGSSGIHNPKANEIILGKLEADIKVLLTKIR